MSGSPTISSGKVICAECGSTDSVDSYGRGYYGLDGLQRHMLDHIARDIDREIFGLPKHGIPEMHFGGSAVSPEKLSDDLRQQEFALLKPGDLIEVLWVDARYMSGWHDRDEIVSWERDFDKYRAAGFFVMVTERNLIFAELFTEPGWDQKKCGGINSIPLSAIRDWWRLERESSR